MARRKGVPVVRTEWLLESAEQWKRLPEEPFLLPDTHSTSGLPPLPPAPPSDEPDEPLPTSATPSMAGDDDGPPVDMTEVDWDAAADEVDAFLNETDDDDNGGDETDGNETDGSVASNGTGPRKRHRASTDSEDENPPPKSNSKASAIDAGSPLQKRVKTSRSRKSKLKVSFPPHPDDEPGLSQSVQLPPRSSPNRGPPSPPPPDGYEPSVGSSSVGSDDDDFGDMAAELESGWGA